MVVDGDEQELPTGTFDGIAAIPGDTVAHAFDAAEFLDIDVDQVTGVACS